ncbi:hypothetical protein [Nocardia sp. NPDC057353]|uniref:hypothetical protein n=1 Tax=Nocardia sp. NPDC057353 TaxID=3346104 RepID=UPI00363E2F83
MSDRATEDEIMDEAKRFGHALAAAAQRHAVATTWLEKRLARKQVSRLMRAQHRDEQRTRAARRKFATESVDRYRQHSLGVAERAADPRTGAEQRTRDLAALGHHRRELQQWLLTEPHLTETQRGIALDGVEAVTEFPQFKLGNSYAPGRRITGMDALRYRAHVARVRAEHGIGRFQRGTAATDRARVTAAATGGAARGPATEQSRTAAAAALGGPVSASGANSSPPQTPATPTATDRPIPAAPGPQQLGLLQQEWVHKLRAAQLAWNAQAPSARDGYTLRILDDRRQDAARQAADAGVSSERIAHELEYAAENSRYTSTLTSSSEHGSYTTRGLHATEQEAAAWVNRVAVESRWKDGVTLRASVSERGGDRPLRHTRGSVNQVRARTTSWTTRTPERGQQRTTTTTSTGAGDVDGAELQELRTRHRLSIEHNADLAEQNARLTRQLTAVTADRDQLAAAVADRGTERRPATERPSTERPRTGRVRRSGPRPARHAQTEREFVAMTRRNAAEAEPQTAQAERARSWALSATDEELMAWGRGNGMLNTPGPRTVGMNRDARKTRVAGGDTGQAAGEQESAAVRDRVATDPVYRPGPAQPDPELAELRADRDRLRGERDEAVAKLARHTAPEQRFGSPERQAQAARDAATGQAGAPESGTDRDLPDSALAEYQPSSIAEMARGHQRNGMAR